MSNEFIRICCFSFLGIAIFLLCTLYIPVIKKVRKQRRTEEETVEYALSVIQSTKEVFTPEKKADAFISLMSSSYVLIHTMINEGNKYDDCVQIKHFEASLTSDIVSKLNALEEL